MTTLPRTRRANGSGSKPRWDAQRQRWEGKISLADGTRRTIRGKTERDYDRAVASLLDDVENGMPTPTELLKLGDYLDDWLESVRISTLPSAKQLRSKRKRKTYASYEGLVRVHIKPALGKESLKLLSTATIQKRLVDAKLRAGSSARRVEMMCACLRIALNRALHLGLIKHNAVLGVDIDVPANSRVGKALTPEQTTHLLAATHAYRYGNMIAFLVSTGLRLGEALALRWSEVDLKTGYLKVDKTLEWMPYEPWSRVDPKALSAIRRVPLVAPAIEALQREKDRQTFVRGKHREVWLDNNLVFSNDMGDAIREKCVWDGFKDGLRRIGLEPKEHRVHDLRHTAATYLHMLGVPPRTIMAIMGHSTMAMTQNYAHVFDPMLDEAKTLLDGFYSRLGTS